MSRREQAFEGTFWGTLIVIIVVMLSSAFMFGVPALARFQAVQNAENQVRLNEIAIQQQAQLIHVQQQKADIMREEARGIADAQSIINSTLTDKYLQHEAIKAQESMANGPNHTTVYIPSGQNGIPLVRTLEP